VNRKAIGLIIDGVVALAMLLYILSLHPTTYVYLKNQLTSLNYKLWMLTHPEWLKEAMQVRGRLSP
jgi:hypothetical protein